MHTVLNPMITSCVIIIIIIIIIINFKLCHHGLFRLKILTYELYSSIVDIR
jgi:hypothetical protein